MSITDKCRLLARQKAPETLGTFDASARLQEFYNAISLFFPDMHADVTGLPTQEVHKRIGSFNLY